MITRRWPGRQAAVRTLATPILCATVGWATAAGAPTIPVGLPSLSAPILVTTCGRSDAARTVASICEDVGIRCIVVDLLFAGDLAPECPPDAATYDADVLFVAVGASTEGMKAAGVDIGFEVARCTALIERAKAMGMFVVIAWLEGAWGRHNPNDEESIRGLLLLADLFIRDHEAGAEDRIGAGVAEEEIPEIVVDEVGALEELLPMLFPAAVRDEPRGEGNDASCPTDSR